MLLIVLMITKNMHEERLKGTRYILFDKLEATFGKICPSRVFNAVYIVKSLFLQNIKRCGIDSNQITIIII